MAKQAKNPPVNPIAKVVPERTYLSTVGTEADLPKHNAAPTARDIKEGRELFEQARIAESSFRTAQRAYFVADYDFCVWLASWRVSPCFAKRGGDGAWGEFVSKVLPEDIGMSKADRMVRMGRIWTGRKAELTVLVERGAITSLVQASTESQVKSLLAKLAKAPPEQAAAIIEAQANKVSEKLATRRKNAEVARQRARRGANTTPKPDDKTDDKSDPGLGLQIGQNPQRVEKGTSGKGLVAMVPDIIASLEALSDRAASARTCRNCAELFLQAAKRLEAIEPTEQPTEPENMTKAQLVIALRKMGTKVSRKASKDEMVAAVREAAAA